jgi:hypothetical protein
VIVVWAAATFDAEGLKDVTFTLAPFSLFATSTTFFIATDFLATTE